MHFIHWKRASITMHKKWYDYLWIWSILYFTLGFFNILFAWLGMIDFLVPLLFAFIGIILGILGRLEKDRFYLFSYIGILLNLVAVGLVSLILYAGALL